MKNVPIAQRLRKESENKCYFSSYLPLLYSLAAQPIIWLTTSFPHFARQFYYSPTRKEQKDVKAQESVR